MNDRVRPIHWLYLTLCLFFQVTAIILGKTAALRMGTPTLGAFLTNPRRVFFLERVTFLNIVGASVILSGLYVVVREDVV